MTSPFTLTKVYHRWSGDSRLVGHGPLSLEVARAMRSVSSDYEIILNAMKHAWPEGRPCTDDTGIADACACARK